MANGIVETVLEEEESNVETRAKLGAMWRDPRKPLGARKAPAPMVPGGMVVKVVARAAGRGTDVQNMMKGKALKSAATDAQLASKVQSTIEDLAGTIGSIPEPYRSINMAYLHYLADATIAAARACQQMRKGKNPSKNTTRMAVSWVVSVGCGLVSPKFLDPRVKAAAVKAYPLFAAGTQLNESIDYKQAIHVAYVKLGVA